jgi:two-component system, OmpR family, phosphate regulon sensor histidine kinase PhoR
LAVAALTISAGLSLAWLGGWLFFGGPWPIRIPILTAILAVTGVSAALLVRTRRRDYRDVQRHFEALCRLDTQTVLADLNSDSLPSLPQKSPWYGVTERIREIITEWRQRVQDLEHARTSLEVRCRRATQQAEQIRQILYGLADPILAIDDYDEIVLANRSAEQLFHLEGEKSETKAIKQLIHCQKLVQLLTTTRQRRTAVHRTDEVEITDAEGCSHWYQATAVKLAAADDGQEKTVADGAVAVLRDIGDQKALQKRNAEFVSSVSHEMKTPLAGIKAYVELLADGDAEDEETREEFLGVINGQADRLQRLVDNLLNLARIEAGVISVSKQQRSLNEVLEEALHVVQPAADAKNIQLISELSPLYLGVLADRDTMLQAAINLLSNAIKYTRNGGKVTLRSRLADEQVRFEVQDTGVGLSVEDSRRVFEKFYRVKKDKEMAAGTGLGLPLAKHIVEDVHGGKLTVESVLDQGSTFIVTLPAAGQMRGEAARN